jgi:hypothetical protein
MYEELFKAKLLAHNIVEVVLADKVYLDISLTDKIDETLHKLAPDRKLYQLVIASGPYIVNPEMRNATAKGNAGVRLLGVAWVSPDNKANQEQEEIVGKLPIPFPIRFFSDRVKALTWLESMA